MSHRLRDCRPMAGALALWLVAAVLHAAPLRVALMAPRPVSKGWNALSREQGFSYAVGTLLSEALQTTDRLVLLPWKDSSGIRGIVDSGLYEFQSEQPFARWRELLDADVYVVPVFKGNTCSYAVHTRGQSTEKTVAEPYTNAQNIITAIITQVFTLTETPFPNELQSWLAQPETQKPELFMLWACWDNFVPSPYARDENPWRRPSAAATTIVKGDTGFGRGLGWALPMLLKPVDIAGKAGRTRAANQPLFDMNALHVMDSRFARRVIPHYNTRLRQDRFLFRNSVALLVVEGHTLEFDLEETDSGLPGNAAMGDRLFKNAESTPRLRRNICLALSGIENRNLIEKLAELLANEPDDEVREAVATSLGGFKPGKAVLAALAAGRTDDASAVRLAVFTALAELGQHQSPVFMSGLKDPDPDIRWAVTSAIIEKTKDKQAARPLLLQALASDEAAIRTHALVAGGSLFDDPAALLPSIASALQSGHIPEQRAGLALLKQFDLQHALDSLTTLLHSPDAGVRAEALPRLIASWPESLPAAVKILATDTDPLVQQALVRAIADSGERRYLTLVEQLLQSPWEATRALASDTVYRLSADDRDAIVLAMLADPSMRVNFAALRVISRTQTAPLLEALRGAVRNHHNEHVRAQALLALEHINSPQLRPEALAALRSPFFIVRLFAAGVLAQHATPADTGAIQAALTATQHRWLKLAMEDALARSREEPPPERIRLNLGQRDHTEGGEIANGIQIWLGDTKDADTTRKMVEEGYRFGSVLGPGDRDMWGMRSWNNSKGRRNTYLLHMLAYLDQTDASLLHYLCLFDEPHSAGGGSSPDMLRAFFLEVARPDLLGSKSVPPELRAQWRYFNAHTLTELSNWVVGVLRQTVQRKYQDLQIFPQSLSYMGGAAAETWHLLDADGDYSWRYDYHNLLGHYGKAAVMRALKPGKPTYMITRIGAYSPNFFRLDTVYTSSKFQPGPWMLRGHLATRAGLALYAGGAEVGYFNVIAFKSMATRGRDTGGIRSYPLTPWSKELRTVIDKMIAGDKTYYWDKVHTRIEAQVMEEFGKGAKVALMALDDDGDLDDPMFDLDDTELKIAQAIKERYEAAVNVHFTNTMIGCSWMNIFNADNSRALSNLPKPDPTSRPTLVILPREEPFTKDGAYFPMAGMALADGFDMVPGYAAVAVVDLNRYDTILIKGSPAGVTGTLVSKLNKWLQASAGLLVVNGNLNASKALSPELIDDAPTERFLWEDTVDCELEERITLEVEDKKGKVGERQVYPRLEAFGIGGHRQEDAETRLHCTYKGKLSPLVGVAGGLALGQWQAPPAISARVLFDGSDSAGPVYTKALEDAVLALDKARKATITRNHWWGHVGVENDQFVIDVATSGYRSLQAARPRHHKGIDIIYGQINPEVTHNTSTLILKHYVGPYAGGLGDWAAMARTELVSMELTAPHRLQLETRGVVRVTHIGDNPIRIANADAFEQVADQLEVWKAMWNGKQAWSQRKIDGGWEINYQSQTPVTLTVD